MHTLSYNNTATNGAHSFAVVSKEDQIIVSVYLEVVILFVRISGASMVAVMYTRVQDGYWY